MSQEPITLKQYVEEQEELIKLEYSLETAEKQKTEIPSIDLCFILRTKTLPGDSKETRKWTTTLPLPKNLIPPEYLIINDPTFVNVSDKIYIEFLKSSKEPIEGTVMKIKDGELTAVFELDWEEDTARHKCSIKFLPNDIVYKRKLNALKKLKHLNNDLKNMLCRKYPTQQINPKMKLNLPVNYEFNESQKNAIRRAVSNPFSLIQGPPGTGKTHTIGAIAIQALRNEPNKKVLICGTTNVSINSLLEIVGDMVQSAGYKVCWPAASARDFLTEEGLTKEQKLMTLYISRHMNSNDSRRFRELHDKYNLTEQETNEMNHLRDKLEEKIIQKSDVIFSTLDSSGKKSIALNIGNISTLIVDEATLSVESSMIIPLSLCPDRFVLVGDHKQLGPQPSFEKLEERGFYYSMFERIIKKKKCLKNSVMLNTQYRMHPDISRFPNNLFYDNELFDGVHPEERMIAKNFIFQKHLNFINFNHEDEQNGTSYINHEEINHVLKFVSSLIKSGVNPSQIGVISAYGAQTHLISENLKWNNIQVKVSTIDSFQGSQKDYIIICTTRNGTKLGFLNDKRRMNVAITRARCLVTVFGNAETLSQSPHWRELIQYTKENDSYYERLPVKIEKMNQKTIVITKNTDNFVREMVSEFKENDKEAGYNLREIKSTISNSNVRILWPDETDDVSYLEKWVEKRVSILDNGKHVTLAYDAESVCMQFGDIFNENIDYYNWDSDNMNIPKIKTNESIIISFYKHKGDHNEDPILINKMKPLLEHQRITLLTFDFTFDFDKLYHYDINITTSRVIDIQLSKLPEDSVLNETKDFICSTGWKSIGEFICQANEDNENASLIFRAKESVKNGKKKFPHEENHFLCKHFNYPPICQFTNIFLEYSAGDIFYTAIAGADILIRGEFEEVKERSQNKLKTYQEYRAKYGSVRYVRQAYYVRESFTSAIQAQFSKENKTYQILSYHKKLDSFVKLLNEHPQLLQNVIPSFNDEDASVIHQRYNDIVDIMKDKENVHLGNIKDKAILAHVQGVQKTPAFVLRFNEEIDEAHEEIEKENKSIKEKEEKEKEAIDEITGGGKNLFKAKSNFSAWTNLDMSQPLKPTKGAAKINSQANNSKNEIKSAKNNKNDINNSISDNINDSMKLNKKSNSAWSKISMPESSMSINDTDKFITTHPNNKKQTNEPHKTGNVKNTNNKSVSNQIKNSQNNKSMKSRKVVHYNVNKNQSNRIMQPLKSAKNIMIENTSNQKQQQETPIKIAKPVSDAWTHFSQSQENRSGNFKNASPHIQNKLPPPAKPPINNDKTKSIQQPIIYEFKPKQSHSSLIDMNSHIDKSYLF